MDPKYFILILFCGHLNNIFLSETEAITTEQQPQSTLFGSSMPHVSATSQSITGNPLGQATKFNVSSGQPIPTAKVAVGHSTPVVYASSGKPAAHASAGQPLAYNTNRQPTPTADTSSQRTAPPMFTSGRQLPTSAQTSSRQLPSSAYTPTQQPSSVHISPRKPVTPTVQNLPTQLTPAIERSPRITPGFNLEATSEKNTPHKTNSNLLATILIGVILTSMLVAITIIVLGKCLRKSVSNDQNWAGRSPYADGETPDICLDNIRENEASTKRTSIISLMAWKPNKS